MFRLQSLHSQNLHTEYEVMLQNLIPEHVDEFDALVVELVGQIMNVRPSGSQ